MLYIQAYLLPYAILLSHSWTPASHTNNHTNVNNSCSADTITSLLYDKLTVPVEGSDEYDDTHADLCSTIFTPSSVVVRQLPFLLKACAHWAGISTLHLNHRDISGSASSQARVDNSSTSTTDTTTTTVSAASSVVAQAFDDIVKSTYDTSITTADILHLWWDILIKYALSSSQVVGHNKVEGQNYDLSLSEHINEVYKCVSCDWLDPAAVHGAYPLKSTVPILPIKEEDVKMDITHNYGVQKGIKSEVVPGSIEPLVIKLKHTTSTAIDDGHNSDTPPLPFPQLPVSTDVPTTTTTAAVSTITAGAAIPMHVATAPPRKFKSLKLSLKTSDNIVTTTTALRYTTTSDTPYTDPTTALDTNDSSKRYTTRGHRLSAEFLRRAVDADIHDIHDTQEQLAPNTNAATGNSGAGVSNSSDMVPSEALLPHEVEELIRAPLTVSTDSNNSIVRQASKKSRIDTTINYNEQSVEGNDDSDDDDEEDAYEQDTILDNDEVESEEEEYEDELVVKGKRRHSTNKRSSSSNVGKKRKVTQDSPPLPSSAPSITTVSKPKSTATSSTSTAKKGHKSWGSSSSIRQNIMKILTSKKR